MNIINEFNNRPKFLKMATLGEAMIYASESDLEKMFQALYNIALDNDKVENEDGVHVFDLDNAVKTMI